MSQIYKHASELPEDEGENPFWNVANSTELKEMIVFQLINELSGSDSHMLDDGQCRTKLGKLEGLAKLMFFREAKNNTEGLAKLDENNTHDELPPD